jgi:hypothetical protein
VAVLVLYPVWRLLASDTLPAPSRSLLFSIIIFCVFNSLAESQFLDGKGWTRPFDHDLRADRSGACDKHHELGLSQAPVNCSAAGQILKRCCLGKGKRGW